jgi:hypothetical protein
MYAAEPTGLVSLAAAVKMYLKSVYGTTNAQYKQISRIQFTTPK